MALGKGSLITILGAILVLLPTVFLYTTFFNILGTLAYVGAAVWIVGFGLLLGNGIKLKGKPNDN